MNRPIYDSCAQVQDLNQSVSPLAYTLDPMKYQHCNKCRPELGIVGGTAVSHVSGNLVDLENDLRGQTRPLTHCPQFKYLPNNNSDYVQGKEYIKPVCHPKVSTQPLHLKPCQFATYPEVPKPPAVSLFSCEKK